MFCLIILLSFFYLRGIYASNGFKTFSLKTIVVLAITFRLTLWFMIPNLSDDFFRFIWDGQLLTKGFSPYQYLPTDFIEKFPQEKYLMEQVYNGEIKHFPNGMNSKNYYSVYPPLQQILFALPAFFAKNNFYSNVILLRLIIIVGEIALILLMVRWLRRLNLSEHLVSLYALNPLVIFEITGNLHFEGWTIFLFLSSLYLLKQKKTKTAGIVYALAILVKLIPLIFLPFFFFQLTKKNLLVFYGFTALTLMFFSMLFFPSFAWLVHLMTSVGLYFNQFEFNASFHYLFRAVGFALVGYNPIGVLAKIIPLMTLFAILALYYRLRKMRNPKDHFIAFALALLIYYALATTVHPWYVVYFVALGVFTPYRFPFLWSLAVLLSYTAFSEIGSVQEQLHFIALEYLILLIAVCLDFKKHPPWKLQKSN